jgi:penicillin amidase
MRNTLARTLSRVSGCHHPGTRGLIETEGVSMKPIARRLARRLVLALSLAAVPAWADPAPVVEHRPLAGLTAPGRVIVDRWGIAHVRAANVHDAFFLQGWNAARDRLWQIDLWRKRGWGCFRPASGGTYLDQDRAARLLLYRGDMRSGWATYPATAHAETEAFVAGINAYVGEVEAGREPLPREFTLTGSRPDHWQADDVLRIRGHALVSNLADEVERAKLICKGRAPFLTLHRRIEPVHAIRVPAGLDPCDIPADVLDICSGPRAWRLRRDRLPKLGFPMRCGREVSIGPGSRKGRTTGPSMPRIRQRAADSRQRDPHRAHGVPSLRYLVDMAAPVSILPGQGTGAAGGKFRAQRNGSLGLTIFPADQEDHVYRTSPLHPGAYLYKGRWEPFRVVRETVAIKGGATRGRAQIRVTARSSTRTRAMRSACAQCGTPPARRVISMRRGCSGARTGAISARPTLIGERRRSIWSMPMSKA